MFEGLGAWYMATLYAEAQHQQSRLLQSTEERRWLHMARESERSTLLDLASQLARFRLGEIFRNGRLQRKL